MYTATVYVDGGPPPIDAAALNNAEQGIAAVHRHAAYVASPTGTAATDNAAVASAMTAIAAAGGGEVVFDAGTYNLTVAIPSIPTSAANGGTTGGLPTIESIHFKGKAKGVTVLKYSPSAATYLFTFGDGTHTSAYNVVEDLTIALGNATAAGAINLIDPCSFSIINRVQVLGNASGQGTGILLSGQVSATAHNLIQACSFRNIGDGIRFSGFANSNCVIECWFGALTNGVHFERAGSDTHDGNTNVVLRCEFNGSTTTAILLRQSANRNTFVGCTFDGPTTHIDVGTGCVGNMFFGCVYTAGNCVFTDTSSVRIDYDTANSTPSGSTSTTAAGSGTGVFTNTKFDGGIGSQGYTIGDLVAIVKTAGLAKD